MPESGLFSSGTLLCLYGCTWITAAAVFRQKVQHLVHRGDIC